MKLKVWEKTKARRKSLLRPRSLAAWWFTTRRPRKGKAGRPKFASEADVYRTVCRGAPDAVAGAVQVGLRKAARNRRDARKAVPIYGRKADPNPAPRAAKN